MTLATSASAGTISYSHDIPNTPANFTDPFNLTKFDTTLGTLTGVTLELDATGQASVDVISVGSGGSFTGAFANFNLTLSGPDGSETRIALAAGPVDGTMAAGSFSNATHAIIPGSIVTGNFTASVPAANWANYEGTGGDGRTLVFCGGFASAGGTALVTYTFDAAAPEPVTLVLIGSALLGLGAFRRFRKA